MFTDEVKNPDFMGRGENVSQAVTAVLLDNQNARLALQACGGIMVFTKVDEDHFGLECFAFCDAILKADRTLQIVHNTEEGQKICGEYSGDQWHIYKTFSPATVTEEE